MIRNVQFAAVQFFSSKRAELMEGVSLFTHQSRAQPVTHSASPANTVLFWSWADRNNFREKTKQEQHGSESYQETVPSDTSANIPGIRGTSCSNACCLLNTPAQQFPWLSRAVGVVCVYMVEYFILFTDSRMTLGLLAFPPRCCECTQKTDAKE